MRGCLFSKKDIAIILTAVIITFTLFGLVVYFSKSDGTSNEQTMKPEEPVNETLTDSLIASTIDGRIALIDWLGDEYHSILVEEESNSIASFDYNGRDGILYYGTTKLDEPIKVWSNDDSYGNYSMNYTREWEKTDMAYDEVDNKLYVLDGSNRTLFVIDIESDYYAVVAADLDEPRDVVLDRVKRLVYVTERSSIFVSYLDGSDNLRIPTTGSVNALTVSQTTGTVYFSQGQQLEFINPVGAILSIVTESKENIVSLAIHSILGFVIYVEAEQYQSETSLSFCVFYKEEKKCRFTTAITDGNMNLISQLLKIKLYEPVEEEFENPCKIDNGDCEHLCIFHNNPPIKYTCMCNVGWVLDDDEKSCLLMDGY